MKVIKEFEKEMRDAWDKFDTEGDTFYDGYAVAFDLAIQIYEEMLEEIKKDWKLINVEHMYLSTPEVTFRYLGDKYSDKPITNSNEFYAIFLKEED